MPWAFHFLKLRFFFFVFEEIDENLTPYKKNIIFTNVLENYGIWKEFFFFFNQDELNNSGFPYNAAFQVLYTLEDF